MTLLFSCSTKSVYTRAFNEELANKNMSIVSDKKYYINLSIPIGSESIRTNLFQVNDTYTSYSLNNFFGLKYKHEITEGKNTLLVHCGFQIPILYSVYIEDLKKNTVSCNVNLIDVTEI